jgi:alkylation response protein AidB-like acyl-CoA dehydrogenase
MESVIEPETLRQQVREWLSEHWNGQDDAAWRDQVVRAGWAVPTFPTHSYGLGLDTARARIIRSEFDAVGAPRSCRELDVDQAGGWIRMAAATVAQHGGDSLREVFIRDLLMGDPSKMVALYSEPSAGSDLASLQTRAVLAGDNWVINGQKVWSSEAVGAEWGVLLARTDEDVPKHQGLTFFVIPMRQPGIDIRPIRQITGDADFNEVFLTDALVPADNVVGQVNDGWRVLQDVLAAEREWLGAFLEAGNRPGVDNSERQRSNEEPASKGAGDLIAAARRAGRTDDEAVRQTIVQLHTWRLVHKWNTDRLLSDESGAQSQVAAAALGKLASSRVLHSVARFKAQMMGPEAMLYGSENEAADDVNREVMNAFINSVGGGTDQIQRNIISERLLGLPRGHTPDRGVPFRDIRKGAAKQTLS